MSYFADLRRFVGSRPLILPGAVAIITDEKGDILLQQRSDGGWGLPGGLMELGESFEETVRREVLEETGLHLLSLQQLHVFSGSDFYLKVANGDEMFCVTAVYIAGETKGEARTDNDETLSLQYFSLNHMPDTLHQSYRTFLDYYQKSLKRV